MAVKNEQIEKNLVKLTFEVSAEEFDKAINQVYKKNANKFNIPGYRKGKAPRKIVEKYYTEAVFYDEAINNVLPAAYEAALEESGVESVAKPEIDVEEIKKGEPVVFTALVTTKPEVTLGEYKGIEVDKIDYTVTDEDVDKDIEATQKKNARVVTVEDRAIENGDIAVIDFEGFVDDVAFDGGKGEGYELEIGSGTFIPGFEEQLVGANTGDDVDVKVTFPEEYHAEDLAGKEAVFHCLVHEIKEEQLPELDDEFAKDVSEYDTLEELKKANRERLEAYAKAGSESQMKDAALGKVVEANEVDVPGTMVEDEMDRMCQELDQQLRYQGMSLEQYLQFTGKDMAAFRNELRPDAERQVKTRIILMGIVEAEGIKVSQEEMEEELKVMAAQYQTTADKLKEMIGVENLTFLMKDLQVKKAIELIFENAVIK